MLYKTKGFKYASYWVRGGASVSLQGGHCPGRKAGRVGRVGWSVVGYARSASRWSPCGWLQAVVGGLAVD